MEMGRVYTFPSLTFSQMAKEFLKNLLGLFGFIDNTNSKNKK
jgi:hypothetical protein